MANKVDAETQTDPEITGVDADDFEEEDEGEETGSESSESEDEEAGEDGHTKSVDRGTSSKPVRRKIIELKYYFGEDLPDAELSKRECGIYNFNPSTWSTCINQQRFPSVIPNDSHNSRMTATLEESNCKTR